MEFEEILRIYEPNTKMHCILYDNIEEFAVAMGYQIDAKTFDQKFGDKTLIEWCSYYGALRCFRYLRAQGVGITEKCLKYSFIGKHKEIYNGKNKGTTPLMAAAANNYPNAISKLVEFGLNIEQKAVGQTALNIAAANNSVNAITRLIELGAIIESKYDEVGSTPLITALNFNHIGSVSKLIELGANLNAEDNNGMIALDHAIYHDNPEAISILIEAGANPEANYNEGVTALFLQLHTIILKQFRDWLNWVRTLKQRITLEEHLY